VLAALCNGRAEADTDGIVMLASATTAGLVVVAKRLI
jgi:hypothetical protein